MWSSRYFIQTFLPVNDRQERWAAAQVAEFIRQCSGGLTRSLFAPVGLVGVYGLDEDQVAGLMTILPGSSTRTDALQLAERLRSNALEKYLEAGRGQEDVWVTLGTTELLSMDEPLAT